MPLTSALIACEREPADDAVATTASAPSASDLRQSRRRSGDNPFGFEAPPLDAQAGDYALVPSRSGIDRAFERGIDAQTFVYLGATVERVGESASLIRWQTEQRGLVSNALVIPIRRGQRANVGDVVLTSWASGSGLERAIVVGGSPESPRVRYLDLALDNPAARANEDDTLPSGTFGVLTRPGAEGTTVACALPDGAQALIVVKRAAERLLGLGFAGRMRVVDAERCAPIPLDPSLRPGERVFVPRLGGFVPAEVESVDARVGRVFVRYSLAGETRRSAVGFINVARALPPAK